jgi:hypothetical protein
MTDYDNRANYQCHDLVKITDFLQIFEEISTKTRYYYLFLLHIKIAAEFGGS